MRDIFIVLYPSLLHMPLLKYCCDYGCCMVSLISNPGLLRLWHWYSSDLSALDLINIWANLSSLLAFGCWLACRKCRIWQLGGRNTHQSDTGKLFLLLPPFHSLFFFYNLQRWRNILEEAQTFLCCRFVGSTPRGYKEMSSTLADQLYPKYIRPNAGVGGSCCGVSANEYSCTQEPK
jgi:hypothetical protein